MHSLSRFGVRAGISLLTLVAALTWSGCAAFNTVAICPQHNSSLVLTALTSPSDIDISKQVGPVVAHEVAQRAANSCATLSTAVADAHPESDLAMTSIELQPTVSRAPNRTPWVAELQRKGETWLAKQFLQSLHVAVAEPGSPVLTTIAAVAMQLRTAGQGGSTVIEITDGFAKERAPNGGTVDFEHPNDPALGANLHSFVHSLRGLEGGCVMIVGAGANSSLGLQRLEQARKHIDEVLDAAGIGMAWTRSPEVPEKCRE